MSAPSLLTLKDKLRHEQLITYGMNIYSGSCMPVETAGHHGLDFVFIDTEHTALGVDGQLEKMLLAARVAGVDALVRVSGTIEAEIRTSLELGATGVIIPQVHNAEQMRAIIRMSKFPGMGRRGGDSSVRSARFAAAGFDWQAYTESENARTVIVPMAESHEFFDDIDAILDVPGIDAVHFGPADYSLSRNLPVDYRMRHPEVRARLEELLEKCHARSIKVMVPCAPADLEQARELVALGCDMLIMGSDLYWLNQAAQHAAQVRATLAQS
ncbi:MAG: aldolase/citrate lyase family protein [Corticimicrobacter sp.]|uniref:HpcH/HpaI aldolase family protein n=1 Tax=Corticimicrobacter sp. TaxID=2678536 RepID=UPI0032DAA236